MPRVARTGAPPATRLGGSGRGQEGQDSQEAEAEQAEGREGEVVAFGSGAAGIDSTGGVVAALDEFDRVFAAGDGDALADLFADDATLLLLHREPLEGRPAIRDHWRRFFAAWDPGAWETQHAMVEVHGDRAYSLVTYTETLVHRGDEPSRFVDGRLVRFLRREADGSWLVTLAMNSHARPVEEVPRERA